MPCKRRDSALSHPCRVVGVRRSALLCVIELTYWWGIFPSTRLVMKELVGLSWKRAPYWDGSVFDSLMSVRHSKGLVCSLVSSFALLGWLRTRWGQTVPGAFCFGSLRTLVLLGRRGSGSGSGAWEPWFFQANQPVFTPATGIKLGRRSLHVTKATVNGQTVDCVDVSGLLMLCRHLSSCSSCREKTQDANANQHWLSATFPQTLSALCRWQG